MPPINIIFDDGPQPHGGRFVEVETDDGRSVNVGAWHRRPDGMWALRITELPGESGDHLHALRGWLQSRALNGATRGSDEPVNFGSSPTVAELESLANRIREATIRELHRRGLMPIQALDCLRAAIPQTETPAEMHWLLLQAQEAVREAEATGLDALLEPPR